MAYRYVVYDVVDGDTPVPDMLNRNMESFAEEMNGFLDRDNLPQNVVGVLSTDFGSQFAFASVGSVIQDASSPSSGVAMTVNLDTKAWQEIVNPDDAFAVTIATTTDEMLIVEASFQITSTFAGGVTIPDDVRKYPSVQIQLTTSGSQICETAEMPLVYTEFSANLVGAIPVVAGSHRIVAFIRYLTSGGTSPTDADSVEVDDMCIIVTRRRR